MEKGIKLGQTNIEQKEGRGRERVDETKIMGVQKGTLGWNAKGNQIPVKRIKIERKSAIPFIKGKRKEEKKASKRFRKRQRDWCTANRSTVD